MTITVVRYKTKPDRGDENATFIEKVFAELAASQPEGLHYASFRLADGVSFVHVASVETADGVNPLGRTEAFATFAAGVADRCDEAPVAMEASVVGSYDFSSWAGAT